MSDTRWSWLQARADEVQTMRPGLVRELVASAPSLPRWSFRALRPAQGFDFEVQAGPLTFSAKQLSFQALSAEQAPSQLAIRLLVPNPQLEAWTEIGFSRY